MHADIGVAVGSFNGYNAIYRVFQRVLYFVETPRRVLGAAAHIFPIVLRQLVSYFAEHRKQRFSPLVNWLSGCV